MKSGYLNTMSVAFLPIRSSYNAERGGVDYLEQELLEISFVSVPANPEALVVARSQGLQREAFTRWLDGGGPARGIVLELEDEADDDLEVEPAMLGAAMRQVIAEIARPLIRHALMRVTGRID